MIGKLSCMVSMSIFISYSIIIIIASPRVFNPDKICLVDDDVEWYDIYIEAYLNHSLMIQSQRNHFKCYKKITEKQAICVLFHRQSWS